MQGGYGAWSCTDGVYPTAFLREHISEWPAMAAAKTARFWRLSADAGPARSARGVPLPLRDLARTLDPLFLWSVASLQPALWGLGLSLRGPRRSFQSLGLLLILYFTRLGVVFFGSPRMQVPIEPLVILFAARASTTCGDACGRNAADCGWWRASVSRSGWRT
jgi:hypothetical protein